jgi:aspartate aminotransferase
MASRLDLVQPSPTLAVAAEADKLKRTGAAVLDFSLGEPDLPSPAAVKAAGVKAIEDNFTHYTAAAGILELRQAIAASYAVRLGAPVKPQEVLVGPGAKAVLFAATLALVNPGDDVVIVAPYWVSFPEQVRLAGGRPVFAHTKGEDGFTIRAAAIEEALTPATRVVIVNAPSNPTGGVLPREEAEKLVRLIVERDLWLVSDETYEAFVYDPADQISLLSYRDRLGERLILVSAFSKTWAMTGWRVGYAIAAESVIKGLQTVQSHDATQAASMSQKAALAALTAAADAPRLMLEEYRARRELLVAGLACIPGVRCVPPRAAFYAFPDVTGLMKRRGLPDSVALAAALLKEQAVATVPGEAFGAPGHIRISYAASREAISLGLERFKRFAS